MIFNLNYVFLDSDIETLEFEKMVYDKAHDFNNSDLSDEFYYNRFFSPHDQKLRVLLPLCDKTEINTQELNAFLFLQYTRVMDMRRKLLSYLNYFSYAKVKVLSLMTTVCNPKDSNKQLDLSHQVKSIDGFDGKIKDLCGALGWKIDYSNDSQYNDASNMLRSFSVGKLPRQSSEKIDFYEEIEIKEGDNYIIFETALAELDSIEEQMIQSGSYYIKKAERFILTQPTYNHSIKLQSREIIKEFLELYLLSSRNELCENLYEKECRYNLAKVNISSARKKSILVCNP